MARPLHERSGTARWHTASRVLSEVRRHPDITRVSMAQSLQLTSGQATEVTARLRSLRLLTETPAPPYGRGRPTTVLRPHPKGPLVLVIDLRQEDWTSAVVSVDGELHDLRVRRHRSREPRAVLGTIRRTVTQAASRYGNRLRTVSLAVAGTVHDNHLVQAATLDWGPVDLTVVTQSAGLPLLLGNDATLAGVAEARTGAASAAATALHLMVGVGVGGTLTVDGAPLTGAHGAGGEYGHLPFGDRTLRCPCGAYGCWDLEVDGRALARHLKAPTPDDPRTFARQVLDRLDGDSRATQAVSKVAAALGSGVAGLVNAHDPDMVTLGGLAIPLRRAAAASFETAYADGLMAFHREHPPPVVDAAHGDDGPLQGAAILGLDHVTTEAAIADWAADLGRPDA